ncbi:helix-turn-helix domain-containing protein, partial [Enterococcus casseliflavus]
MAKYPFELKLKIVKEYLSGVGGYRYLANKYGISSKSQVSNWVNAYREYGEEGLLRKHQNQKYSVQFKLNALELYQTSEMSYREVAS